MKNFIALAVCLFLASAASAADRTEGTPLSSDRVVSPNGLSAELYLSEDGTRALARLANCREDVRDWPQQCSDEVKYVMTGLAVDPASRTISLGGDVVARWSRFGRFVRMEPSFRLGHEIAITEDSSGAERYEIRRAKLFLTRVGTK